MKFNTRAGAAFLTALSLGGAPKAVLAQDAAPQTDVSDIRQAIDASRVARDAIETALDPIAFPKADDIAPKAGAERAILAASLKFMNGVHVQNPPKGFVGGPGADLAAQQAILFAGEAVTQIAGQRTVTDQVLKQLKALQLYAVELPQAIGAPAANAPATAPVQKLVQPI